LLFIFVHWQRHTDSPREELTIIRGLAVARVIMWFLRNCRTRPVPIKKIAYTLSDLIRTRSSLKPSIVGMSGTGFHRLGPRYQRHLARCCLSYSLHSYTLQS